MFNLTRDALQRRLMDELWKAKRATGPRSIAKILVSPGVVTEVRRELGRQSYRATDSEVTELMKATIRSDCQ